MFSLRQGAFAFAICAFGAWSAHGSGISRAPTHDPVVDLASGVMASFGTAPAEPRETPAQPEVAIDPQTGQAIYVPTGEVIDQVTPVNATRVLRVESPCRQAAAGEPMRVSVPDGGADLPTQREVAPSAT